jgi:hypothetical protein
MKKMTRKKRGYFLFLIVFGGTFLLTSCPGRFIHCGDPEISCIRIMLVDKNDSNLIGKRYDPDSISLSVNHQSIAMDVENGSILIYFPGLQVHNSENYLLYLSKEDTDTLNLRVYEYSTKDCGTYFDFGGMKYNSADVSSIPGDYSSFKIRKD